MNTDRGDTVSIVTGADGRYSMDATPGQYRFGWGGQRDASGEPAILVQVGEGEQRLDFGPAPGLASLTVQLQSERGRALWVVAGDVASGPALPMALMKARYGQLLYQPQGQRITLQGLPPGHYTVVWSNFQPDDASGPIVRTVDLPTSADLVLASGP